MKYYEDFKEEEADGFSVKDKVIYIQNSPTEHLKSEIKEIITCIFEFDKIDEKLDCAMALGHLFSEMYKRIGADEFDAFVSKSMNDLSMANNLHAYEPKECSQIH